MQRPGTKTRGEEAALPGIGVVERMTLLLAGRAERSAERRKSIESRPAARWRKDEARLAVKSTGSKKLSARRAAEGCCTHCGEQLPRDHGWRKCDRCLRGNAEAARAGRAARRREGRCTKCGETRTGSAEESVCRACLTKLQQKRAATPGGFAALRRRERAGLKSQGLCPECGAEPETGFVKCERCRKRGRKRSRKHRAG